MNFDNKKNCMIKNIDIVITGSLMRFIFYEHFCLVNRTINHYFNNNQNVFWNNNKNSNKQLSIINKYKDKVLLNFNINKKKSNSNFLNHFNSQLKKFNRILFKNENSNKISEIGYSYDYIQTKNIMINLNYNLISEIIFDPFINIYLKNKNEIMLVPFDIKDEFDTYNAFNYFIKFNKFNNTNYNYSFDLFKNLVEEKHNNENTSNYYISKLLNENNLNFKYICLIGVNYINNENCKNDENFDGYSYMLSKISKFKCNNLVNNSDKNLFSKLIKVTKIDINLNNINKINNFKEIEDIYLWILKNLDMDEKIFDLKNKMILKENINYKLNEKTNNNKICKIF